MAVETYHPLLIVPAPERLDVHVRPVPAPADNLFERLIRDPQNLHHPKREGAVHRDAAGLQIACPTLQTAVLKLLAG